jgi:hypothetical protein
MFFGETLDELRRLSPLLFGLLLLHSIFDHMPRLIEHMRNHYWGHSSKATMLRTFDGYLGHVQCFALAAVATHSYFASRDTQAGKWAVFSSVLGLSLCALPVAFPSLRDRAALGVEEEDPRDEDVGVEDESHRRARALRTAFRTSSRFNFDRRAD